MANNFGHQIFGINTVSMCQQNCINNADCVAIDFIYNQCWMHTNAENVNFKIQTIGATQYVRCTRAGESTFMQINMQLKLIKSQKKQINNRKLSITHIIY